MAMTPLTIWAFAEPAASIDSVIATDHSLLGMEESPRFALRIVWVNNFLTRAQAPPGNALFCRLCLPSIESLIYLTFSEAEPRGSAFPSGERVN